MLPVTPSNPLPPPAGAQNGSKSTADEPYPDVSHEALLAIHAKFRAVKHSACNALAVIMALSEMAERNPAYMEKLTKAVLTKSPQMVTELRAFDDEFRALLNARAE